MNRRSFLKSTISVALCLGFAKTGLSDEFMYIEFNEKKDTGDMPKRRLGKTGEMVSILGVGGYHIGRMRDERYAIRMVHTAIDEGVNFFDSAWSYNDGESERRIGKALQGRRDKAFVMTKSRARDKVAASRELHESLRRLRTDYIDLWQFHDLQTSEDIATIFGEGGAIEAALQAKKEGKVRYIGFTGHRNPEVHKETILGYHRLLDTVQMPVNVIDPHYLSFVHLVIPEAITLDIGILAMKTTANGVLIKESVATIKECLHYAWNQRVGTVVSGMDSIEQLKENIGLAKKFHRLSEKEQNDLIARTEPFAGIRREFYKHPSVNWRIYPEYPLH